VLEAGAHVLLLRTAAVFGGRQSFPHRILDRALADSRLRVVADQRVNPTYAKDLAAAAVELVETGTAGIVHAVADGCTGWDDFARATLEEFGVSAAVESVSSADYRSAARRPLNGCLGTTRYRPLRPWREALTEWATGLKTP
jgi:dTDP-4-dehydrorhamnose reductase